MIIHRLKAENIGPYEHLELDFRSAERGGVTYVVGVNHDQPQDDAANAIGKSMAVDTIAVALYGRSLEGKTLRALIHRYHDKPLKTTIWVDNLVVRRTIRPTKGAVDIRELDDAGNEGPNVSKGVEDIERRLGMNFATFQLVFRFGGSETRYVPYAEAGAEFLRRVQDTLIQADRITKCLAEARATRLGLEKRSETLRGLRDREQQALEEARAQVADLDVRRQQTADEICGEIASLQPFVDGWSGVDFNERRQDAADFAEYHRQAQAADDRRSMIMQRRAERQALHDKKQRDIEQARQTLGSLPKLPDSEELEERVARAKGRTAELRSLVDKHSANSERRFALQAEMASERQAQEEAKSQLEAEKRAQRPIGPDPRPAYGQLAKQLQEAKEGLQRAEEMEEQTRTAFEAFGDPSARLVVAQREVKAVEGTGRQILAQIAELERQIGAFDELQPGTKCPVCHGLVAAENIDGPRDHLRSEIAGLRQKLVDAQPAAMKLQAEVEECRKAEGLRAQAQRAWQDARAARIEASSVRDTRQSDADLQLASCQQWAANQAKLENSRTVCRQLETLIDGHQRAIDRIAKEYEKLGADPEKLADELQAAENELTVATGEAERLMVLVEAREKHCMQLETQIDGLEEQQVELREEMGELEQQAQGVQAEADGWREKAGGLLYDDGSEPETVDTLNAYERRLHEAQERLKTLGAKLDNNPFDAPLAEAQQRLTEREGRLSELNTEYASVLEDLPYAEWWAKAFDSEGIRSLVLGHLAPALNERATHYLEAMGNYGLHLSFDQHLALHLKLVEDGREVEYAECSGGQRKRLNIATSLAFRDVIRQAANCDLNLFMVDEAGDTLDAPGIRGLAECLMAMSEDDSVWVITHHPLLQALFDQRGARRMVVNHRNRRSELTTG